MRKLALIAVVLGLVGCPGRKQPKPPPPEPTVTSTAPQDMQPTETRAAHDPGAH